MLTTASATYTFCYLGIVFLTVSVSQAGHQAEQDNLVAGNVAQMQATLHQERLCRQDQQAISAKLEAEKVQIQIKCTSLEARLKVLTDVLALDFTKFFCFLQNAAIATYVGG